MRADGCSLTRAARLALAGLAFFAAVLAQPAPGWADPPRIERVVSPKGVVAWLIAEPAVPLVAVRFAFRGGAALDPEGREGLAQMVSFLLDEGAGPFDSEAFQDKIADLAVRLSFDTGYDAFGGSLETLSEHKAEAFELLRLALNEPRFDPEPVERIRQQMLIAIAERADDPDRLAMRSWLEGAFPGHPYGRPVEGTEASLRTIAAADLDGFARARFARDNLVVAVVGDITADQLAPLLDQAFGELPEHAAPWQVPDAEPADPGSLQVLRRPVPQSVVVLGGPGPKRDDPDFYAAYVMNEILGGGSFTARLTKEVREKRGLAYAVYTYLNPLDRAGLFMGGVATQNDRVAESLDLIKEEMTRFRERGATAEELDAAKRQITGSYPLRFDSNEHLADFLVGVALDGFGPDYVENRNKYMEAVTLDDVNRVAARLLQPDKLSVVVVGEPVGLVPGD